MTLICAVLTPHCYNEVNNCDFIECVKRTYDAISHAKETILVGDFNINMIIPDNVMVNEVCHVYNVRNLIKLTPNMLQVH